MGDQSISNVYIAEGTPCSSLTNYLGSLKIHELELHEEDSQNKGKSIVLKTWKQGSIFFFFRVKGKQGSSKALKVEEPLDELDQSYDEIKYEPFFQSHTRQRCGGGKKSLEEINYSIRESLGRTKLLKKMISSRQMSGYLL